MQKWNRLPRKSLGVFTLESREPSSKIRVTKDSKQNPAAQLIQDYLNLSLNRNLH